MTAFRHLRLAAAVTFALLFGAASAGAQQATSAKATGGDALSSARSALIDSTENVKANTEELLRLEEEELSRAAAKHEQLRQLHADGIIAKNDLDASERALEEARAKLEERRGQIAASDRLIAEIEAAKIEAARVRALPAVTVRTRGYTSGPALIRYTGRINMPVAGLAGMQSFFSSRFGRQLPVSAVGQTATHDRLGYDHSHAIDIAVHPDSAEGQALISYLRSAGIAFLAFRSAVPGVATGPHIHIGRPSNRIS